MTNLLCNLQLCESPYQHSCSRNIIDENRCEHCTHPHSLPQTSNFSAIDADIPTGSLGVTVTLADDRGLAQNMQSVHAMLARFF